MGGFPPRAGAQGVTGFFVWEGGSMFRTKIGLCLVLVSLVGCYGTSQGSRQIADEDTLAKIKPGETTKEEVKQLLGEPMNVGFDDDYEIWTYWYSKTHVRKSTWVPVVGAFTGGADTDMTTLTVRFGPDGLVKNVGKGSSAVSVGGPLGKDAGK
jgi:outer membrane protein assembly factor BamE (lipoprotein component of BamABCDE complex)